LTVNDNSVIALPASANFTPEMALKSMLVFGEALTDVIAIGYKDGNLVIRSSRLTRSEVVFMLEKAKEWAMDPESGK
jgi:hypothetical protein